LLTFLHQGKKVSQGLRDEIPFGEMFWTLLIVSQLFKLKKNTNGVKRLIFSMI
jgi:hypothetical protein